MLPKEINANITDTILVITEVIVDAIEDRGENNQLEPAAVPISA